MKGFPKYPTLSLRNCGQVNLVPLKFSGGPAEGFFEDLKSCISYPCSTQASPDPYLVTWPYRPR